MIIYSMVGVAIGLFGVGICMFYLYLYQDEIGLEKEFNDDSSSSGSSIIDPSEDGIPSFFGGTPFKQTHSKKKIKSIRSKTFTDTYIQS